MTDKELTDILHDKRNELAKVELSIADLKAHKAYLSGQIKFFEKELKRREKWAKEVTKRDENSNLRNEANQ
jgi:predicted  nucleic acid-binding Zn-ribbon protein